MQYDNRKGYCPSTNCANKRYSKYINNYNSRTDRVNKQFFKGIKESEVQEISIEARINKKFFRYINRGDVQNVVGMLKNGFDGGASSYEALYLSAEKGHLEIVTKLLEHEAHACFSDEDVLHFSVKHS